MRICSKSKFKRLLRCCQVLLTGTDFAKATARQAVACPTSKVDHDTGFWPDRNPAGVAFTGSVNEVWDLSDSDARLSANGDSFFPDWQGPYLSGPFQDPWGHDYFFDADYEINGVKTAVVGSFGPNGCCQNVYDDDNIILIIPAN
jgi:hypothetical protein